MIKQNTQWKKLRSFAQFGVQGVLTWAEEAPFAALPQEILNLICPPFCRLL